VLSGRAHRRRRRVVGYRLSVAAAHCGVGLPSASIFFRCSSCDSNSFSRVRPVGTPPPGLSQSNTSGAGGASLAALGALNLERIDETAAPVVATGTVIGGFMDVAGAPLPPARNQSRLRFCDPLAPAGAASRGVAASRMEAAAWDGAALRGWARLELCSGAEWCSEPELCSGAEYRSGAEVCCGAELCSGTEYCSGAEFCCGAKLCSGAAC
jgi:hypothetical protein